MYKMSFLANISKDVWTGLVNPTLQQVNGVNITSLEWIDGTPLTDEPDWFPRVVLSLGASCLRLKQDGVVEDKECIAERAFVCQFYCGKSSTMLL